MLAREPTLMGVNVVSEPGCNEQVAPVDVRKVNCGPQSGEVTVTKSQRGETYTLKRSGVRPLAKRKIVAALLDEQTFRLVTIGAGEQDVDPRHRSRTEVNAHDAA
jgi:hypothetical protein